MQIISKPLLQLLAFLFRSRQDHREVRSVHLKEDAVLRPDVVGKRCRVNQLVVLVISEALLHHDVQHRSRVGNGHLGLLLIAGLYHKVLRKSVGEDTPDTIGVQLKGSPDS